MRRVLPKSRRPEPSTGRNLSGRLYDGDRVRPPGYARWADLLDRPGEPAGAPDFDSERPGGCTR
jgi:hypothetical protein